MNTHLKNETGVEHQVQRLFHYTLNPDEWTRVRFFIM